MKRRLLASILSLIMVISLLPTAVLAADEEQDPQSLDAQAASNSDPVVSTALTEAGGALASGTYTLTADIALTGENLTIPADAEVVLDLNGHTLTGTGIGSVIRVAGTLTIQDSGTGGKITGGNKNQTEWKNDNDHNGGALFIDTTGKVRLDGGELSGNQAWNGGGVYTYTGGYLEMNGGVISNNKSLRNDNGGGGGVYALSGAKFVMNNGVIENNSTLTQGGGAFISGEMEMNGGVIRDNHAMIGGGVCINGTMTMNNGSIVNNRAEYLQGSNYYQIQAGGIKVNGGTLNLLGGTVSGNTATSTQGQNPAGQDIAAAIGGGIYSIGTLNVSGAPVVEDNATDTAAQNVYLDAGRTITLLSDLAANAKLPATVSSGAGRVTVSNGCAIPEGVVTSDANLTVNVRAGDIYFTEEVPEEEAVCSIVVGKQIAYYKTLSAAMASLPSDDNVVTLLKDCELTSSVGVASGVRATLTSETEVSITWPETTAAFFVVSSGAELTVKGQITVQGPDEGPAGSTVGTNSSLNAFNVTGTLNIGEAGAADAEFPKVQGFNTSKTTTADNALAKSSTGGAVYVRGGTVNLYSGTLCNNTSIIGGAIYAYDKGTTVNLYGGKISQNVACNGAGVAVRSGASVHLFGSSISGNTAAHSIGGIEYKSQGYSTGGGIYLDQSSELTMSGGSVANNIAESGIGGGIYMASQSRGEMTGGEISGNKAMTATTNDWNANQARGGGIFVSNASFTLTDGAIKNNASEKTEDSKNRALAGGGVCVSGSENTPGQFTMTGGSITGNTCPNSGGGVYITANGTAKLTGGSISQNTALYGSGVYLAVSVESGEVLQMEGNPSVIGNTNSSGTADNVYLESGIRSDKVTHVDQVITLTGAMTPGANVSVTRAGSSSVVAKSGNGYTITDQDALYFTVDNGVKLIQKASSENQLVLTSKSGTYHKITLVLPDHIKADRAIVSEVADGTTCTITFTADEGYAVETVKIGDTIMGNATSVTVSKIAADTTITVTEKTLPIQVTDSTREISGVYGTPMVAKLEVTATYSADSIIKSYALADGSSLPAGLTLSADGEISGTPAETTQEAGQTATVVVTANNGETAEITLTVKIAKATPSVSIAADKATLTGSGRVTLTVSGVPEGGSVTVTQTDDQNSAAKTLSVGSDGKYAVDLPNRTATYTFTVNYDGDSNYNARSATCTVSVTGYYYAPVIPGSSVSVPATASGSVTVSPSTASRGTTVTVTTKPNEGYELGSLEVLDKNGNALALKDLGNGKYSFTMPDGKVSVNASFVKASVSTGFADVPANAYYADAVKWAVDKGVTNGLSANLFGPYEPCTRAQIVTFLWRAAGSPEPKATTSQMTDLDPNAYYYKAVLWAIENGITAGMTDTTFAPNATCTRGQSVTFLYRALGKKASGSASFSDVASSAFYADAVNWAVESSVTNGTSATTFSPNADCTRAEIVTFLYRAYQGK